MKLASYRDGSRDGQLVVVSRDLMTAHYATGIATRLQQVLDDWNFLSPQLEALSRQLDHGHARHAFAFDPEHCEAPLPRAFHLVDGARSRPLAGDATLGARESLAPSAEAPRLDFGAGLAVVTGDVAHGVSTSSALESVRLLALVNAWFDAEGDLATGFAPVAVTPDELLSAWHGGRLRLDVEVSWNGKRVGAFDAGADRTSAFGPLIATLAQRRRLRAGTIVTNGALSGDAARGLGTLAVRRADEAKDGAEAVTPWARPGDAVRVEVKGVDGQGVFGAIEQTVAAPPA